MTAACLLVRSPACNARQLQTSIVQVVHCTHRVAGGALERGLSCMKGTFHVQF